MGHDISRIAIVDFSAGASARAARAPSAGSARKALPPPPDARASERPPRVSQPSEPPAAPTAATTRARFDVSHAKCTTQDDEDRLLAVIETCGAGADTFNQWMTELLLLVEAERATAATEPV
jgi:hypothetical protein